MGNDLHRLLVRPAYDVAALVPSVPFESIDESTPVCIAIARVQNEEEDKAASSRVEKRRPVGGCKRIRTLFPRLMSSRILGNEQFEKSWRMTLLTCSGLLALSQVWNVDVPFPVRSADVLQRPREVTGSHSLGWL